MFSLIIFGILIPFLGTLLGAAFVFFLKNNLNCKLEKFFLGIASGVMIAASIWSLIIPSLERSAYLGNLNWLPATLGFCLGIIFLLFLDKFINRLKEKEKQTNMLFLAVTLHNIPEGMAVGAGLALALKEFNLIFSALVLAIGIAIQNIPEGTIISLPAKVKGATKTKAFFLGVASGIVEPIAGVITILLTNIIIPILPFLLSFAAGAMIYVVVEELIPDDNLQEKTSWKTVGLMFGFVLMMILDVTLS